jgi:hypothetical protein
LTVSLGLEYLFLLLAETALSLSDSSHCLIKILLEADLLGLKPSKLALYLLELMLEKFLLAA